jgi:hypothetical protein
VAEIENLPRRFIEDGLSLDCLMDFAKIVGKKYYMGRRESGRVLMGELARQAKIH